MADSKKREAENDDNEKNDNWEKIYKDSKS